MRRKETRPTSIYWLVDTRTNTPFYCGKTVQKIEHRLHKHKSDISVNPHRPISKKLSECKENVRICVVEVVPAADDWTVREKHWIALLRKSFPDVVNIADGGQGVSGYIPTEATRQKLTIVNRRKAADPAFRARLSIACTGRRYSDETKAKVGAAHKGKTISPEHRAILSAAHKGKPKSAEQRAKMSASAKAWRAAKHV